MKAFVEFCANRGHIIPEELIREFDAEVRVGDSVRVMHEQFGHEFENGEIVEVINIDSGDSFQCTNKSHKWWLCRSEFEKI
jgi:hypothetical protein